jgi:hypothetical protein
VSRTNYMLWSLLMVFAFFQGCKDAADVVEYTDSNSSDVVAETSPNDVGTCSTRIEEDCPCTKAQAYKRCCAENQGGFVCVDDRDEGTYHWVPYYDCGCIACHNYEKYPWCLGYKP